MLRTREERTRNGTYDKAVVGSKAIFLGSIFLHKDTGTMNSPLSHFLPGHSRVSPTSWSLSGERLMLQLIVWC